MKTFRSLSILFLLSIITAAVASAQWVRTSLPYSGVVSALVANGTNLFAGASGAGVFLSTDDGVSWTAVNTGLTDNRISALAVSGANLFAGTWGGIFLSTNDGASWTAVNAGLTDKGVNCFAVSGVKLFAGTGSGVFLSTDNGSSWTAANTGATSSVNSLAVYGANLFAANLIGVFRSTNDGSSWTNVSSGLPGSSGLALAVNSAPPGNLFASMFMGGVYRSTNNGAAWQAVNTGAPFSDIFTLCAYGTNLYAGSDGDGVYYSTNNGAGWKAANTGLTNLSVNAFAVSGSLLFAGTNDGVFRRLLSQMTSVSPASNEVSKAFQLEQNYPNPSASGAVITFSLPQAGFAILKVFSMHGKEMATLVSETLDAGTYKTYWQAGGLPNGTYLYRLQAGSSSETRKLVLMK
jgi:hypothetical protein